MRHFSICSVVVVALGSLTVLDAATQADDAPTPQEDVRVENLRAHVLTLEAEVRQLKTAVESLRRRHLEERVLGSWASGNEQAIVLSFGREHQFEIAGNPPTGPVHGRGTWKLDENGGVVATYKYDGNPEWSVTELPLTYKNIESLEFAGVRYQRAASEAR